MKFDHGGFLVGVVLPALVGACATMTLTNAWKDPAYNGPGFRRLLVAGAIDSPISRPMA
jgi:hypothetical protein